MKTKIERVEKRDGTIVDFDQTRISDAIFKALTATGQGDGKRAKKLSDKVVQILNRRFKKDEIPQVEQIQDVVEEVLILEGLVKTAKAYILYREQRRRIREAVKVSEEAVERLDQYLEKLDWEVQENANMAFSLQGLNHYGVSYIVKKYWLNKIYPKEIREANESGDFHIHNLDTLGPYTFFGREVVIAKLNNKIKLISFKDLYDEIQQPETLLNKKDEAFAKYPTGLLILDKDGWTNVTRIVRKKKEREMRFIKSEQGKSIIVTDNHPFIVKDEKEGWKEIEAKEVQGKKDLILSCHIPSLLLKEKLFFKKYLYLAEELLEKGLKDFFLEGFEWQDFIKNWGGSLRVEGTLSTANWANSLDNKLELSEEFGYLVGLFIAEGNYDGWRLVISSADPEIINRVRRACARLGVHTYLKNKESGKAVSINCSTLKLIFEKIFKLKRGSKNKNLPPDILTYNFDFIKGVIAGIIDGDGTRGTKNKNGEITQTVIRVSSRTMLEQIAILLQFLGIIGRDGVSTKDIGKKNIFRGKEIIQNYPLYRLSFSKKEDVDFPSFKYRKFRPARKHWRAEEYGWNKVLNNEFTTIADDFIYDITTESHTFLCNGLLVHNCVGWDLYDLLIKGFGGVPGKVESKPAKHFNPILGQVVNFIFTLQGEAAGAIAFSNFDTLLAPFIRYDNLNYQQVKQALQEFLFNMAIPTRVGFQCPFSNITLDLKPSPVFAKQPVIIGGKPQDKTYGDFEEEMKIFDKALYEVYMEGDAKGRPFHFPIPTINITKDFPWQESAFDGIFEASAKYGTNYFANYIQSEMKPEDVRSMCIDGNEEILIRNSKKIKRFPIKKVAENYKTKEFDKEGWADCKKEGNLEVLSLNPQTLRLEWSPVKRFLKIFDKKAIKITIEDGKKAIFSLKHPMAIYTPEGLKMKFAKDIKIGEKILVTDSLPQLQKIGNSEDKLKLQKVQPVSIKEVKIRKYKQLKEFYDLELEKNHLFVHSLGQISFNCCRLRLNLTELYNRGGGGLFGSGSLTGSIGVVTIGLPRIGYLSKTKKEFFERLGRLMDLAKESLEIKRKVIENFIEKGLYPYSRFYLQGIKQMRGKYWANHFSTIGLAGMNEAILNFIGENIASKRGRKFALEVLDFMRERLVKYQKETGNIYNLEQTPAESTAHRLALLDKERYPDIITAGTKKVPYYTNSSQLPVNYTDDIFEALKLQDELTCKYTGGSVFHVFLGERMPDAESVKKLIKKVFENFKLPYITLTPTFSICPAHGYLEGEHFFCPKCTIKQPCEVYSRVVGYYRPVMQFNVGKQTEYRQRKEFKIRKFELAKT